MKEEEKFELKKKAEDMGCSNSRSAVKLTDEDVQFLMKNTSYTEKEIRDWYKGFQVDCPDGKLSRDKFIDIYSNFFKVILLNENAKLMRC